MAVSKDNAGGNPVMDLHPIQGDSYLHHATGPTLWDRDSLLCSVIDEREPLTKQKDIRVSLSQGTRLGEGEGRGGGNSQKN